MINYTEAVKNLRKKMILSQMEFAEYLGVSFGTVNRWDNGKFASTIKLKKKFSSISSFTLWIYGKYNFNGIIFFKEVGAL